MPKDPDKPVDPISVKPKKDGLLKRLVRRADDSSILKLLDHAGKLTILVAIGMWVLEYPDRKRSETRAAWAVVNAKGGGRMEALEFLAKEDVDIRGLNVQDGFFDEIDLSGKNLLKSDFARATLESANFDSAILNDSILAEARLTDSKFRRAFLLRANILEADLKNADFTDAHLNRADLRRATAYSADFRKAHFQLANLQEVKLIRADLRDADLRRADLRKALVVQVNLSGADLREADLKDAELTQSNFDSANLQDVKNLTQNQLDSAFYIDVPPQNLPNGLRIPPKISRDDAAYLLGEFLLGD